MGGLVRSDMHGSCQEVRGVTLERADTQVLAKPEQPAWPLNSTHAQHMHSTHTAQSVR